GGGGVLGEGLEEGRVRVGGEERGRGGRRRLPPGRDRRQRLQRLAQPGAGPGRLLLADPPQGLLQRRVPQLLRRQRRRAGEQLVEEHAQRVDVAARVGVVAPQPRLLGAPVLQ